MSKVSPIPEGYHTVQPYLVIKGAAQAIEFYKKAFGAIEVCRMPGPGGQGIMHAEIKIGDSFIFLSDECGQFPSPQTLGGTPVSLMLYVPDVDAVFNQAVAAGATSQMAPQDMFWGDRFSKLLDPFGHYWSVATHIENVQPDEMNRRAEAFFAEMAAKQSAA